MIPGLMGVVAAAGAGAGAGGGGGGGGSGSAYEDAVKADSPSLYFRLGESSGPTAEDSSGNGNDGTYQNSPTLGAAGLLTDDPDTAVVFEESNSEHITTSYLPPTGTDVRTFEFWYSGSPTFNDTDDTAMLLGYGGNAGGGDRITVRMEDGGGGDTNNGKIRVEVGGGFIIFSTDISDGGIYHVVIVFPSGSTNVTDFRCWVNGVEETADATNSQAINTASTNNLRVANDPANTGRFLDGKLDEVAIYEAELSEARIQEHYNVGTGA